MSFGILLTYPNILYYQMRSLGWDTAHGESTVYLEGCSGLVLSTVKPTNKTEYGIHQVPWSSLLNMGIILHTQFPLKVLAFFKSLLLRNFYYILKIYVCERGHMAQCACQRSGVSFRVLSFHCDLGHQVSRQVPLPVAIWLAQNIIPRKTGVIMLPSKFTSDRN